MVKRKDPLKREKILAFLDDGKEVTLHEIEKATGIDHTTIKIYLDPYLKNGFLKITQQKVKCKNGSIKIRNLISKTQPNDLVKKIETINQKISQLSNKVIVQQKKLDNKIIVQSSDLDQDQEIEDQNLGSPPDKTVRNTIQKSVISKDQISEIFLSLLEDQEFQTKLSAKTKQHLTSSGTNHITNPIVSKIPQYYTHLEKIFDKIRVNGTHDQKIVLLNTMEAVGISYDDMDQAKTQLMPAQNDNDNDNLNDNDNDNLNDNPTQEGSNDV